VTSTQKVKFPLGLKLAIIIGLIVLVSLMSVTFLNSYFVGEDVKITAEDNNLTLNTRSSETVQDKLETIRSNALQLLDMVNVVNGGKTSALARQAEQFFFERNADIALIAILSQDDITRTNGNNLFIENTRFYISNEVDTGVQDAFLKDNVAAVNRSCDGETVALNASPYYSIPVMALLLPYKDGGRDQTCVILFAMQSLSDILGTSTTNTTFMINDSDDLLMHPDTDRVTAGESLKNNPLVVAIRSSNQNNDASRQIPFKMIDESTGVVSEYYGAYQKLSLADIVVCTTVPLDIVLEGVRTTRRNNLLLTAAILFLSIAFILIFSRTAISRHLRKLTAAAGEIQKGNFNTDIITKLNTKRRDEIGVLNQSTKDEREFLNIFAKFTNQGVAKAIATKSIDFNPHLKDCTIFFSDIRGFTAISDGFKNRFGSESAGEIITFLNDYMSRMVNCVTLSHGNIDKFEGDAIMGVWGILRDDDLTYGGAPEGSAEYKEREAAHMRNVMGDAINCVRGIIAMRYALMKYNKDAESFTKAHESEPRAQYKPHIRIGCGINTGRVTAGIMGSESKMEYTAIGDAVNFASRTESTNKPCGTDILITEDTYNLLKADYIRTPENNYTIKAEYAADEIVVEEIPVTINVKGKGDQHFYGVVNMPQFDLAKFFKAGDPQFELDHDCEKAVGPSGPKTLAEVRAMLGIPVPDFEKVNLNEEEDKTVISKK
jgi:adenylate cyclase